MQKWREYWGLTDDPFTCEDADKDLVLTEVDPNAVHWSFDRMFGNPRMPAPAISFGEKGSGKSALRLMIKRRVEEYNREHPEEKVFQIEYIDFNPHLENFRRAVGIQNEDPQSAHEALKRWRISDHIDCILSLGITKLVDDILDKREKSHKLSRKQKTYLLVMTTLYYNSDRRTTPEALKMLKSQFGYFSMQGFKRFMALTIGTGISVGIGLAPLHESFPFESTRIINSMHALGALGLVGIWGYYLIKNMITKSRASYACQSVKIIPHESINLKKILKSESPKERREFVLPRGSDAASRYQLLDHFMGLLEVFNYEGIYVLLDRIDEPSMLSTRVELMRIFIEKLLDIKFLQYPKLGLKLFLPIELDEIHRNASPEQLKKMRLDKSNLISELKWSGQELYEIANQRLQSCQKPEQQKTQLANMFSDDFDFNHLRDTLSMLGTPRYAFGFFSSLFTEYVKDLPNDISEDDPRWKISPSHFEVIKATWIDKSGVLRRVLN